ncbi:Pentatricopeptide repeat [Macleaya cordata]|uniref:Pentatricopeptide repeat n=1 Tax=Macleaya cordata TaxID=56857 RepID=A0A200R9K9_MACCD|nr:Pentatricopeptide repeat [Macleaya cordata]
MPSKSPTLLLTPKQLSQIQAHIITNPKPNLLNSLLRTLTFSNNPRNALLLYNQMLQNPTSHDHFTYTYSLKACSLLHEFHKGREIHARNVKSGHGTDIFIQNSLIWFYSDLGDVFSARRIFKNTSSPDIVSWTSIISGLVKNGYEEEALMVFGSIDIRPNSMTLVSILSACSQLRALRLGKAVHGYNVRNILNGDNNIFVDNSILNFYAECGLIVSARNLFESMHKRDVVSWTTMIGGYAKTGFYEEAIRVFQVMIEGGEAEPNEATLVTILSVCVSVGSLSLGQWVHSYMDGKHDFMMDVHVRNALMNMYVKFGDMGMAVKVFKELKCKDLVSWSIMIGGMAMNGHGKQALQLFSLMLINGFLPDSITFISLLSACSHGGLVEEGLMFFKAMKDIYKIKPEMQHFACIVDMYGRAGFFNEAEAFIREMPVEPDGPVLSALVNAYKIHGDSEMCDRLGQSLVSTRDASVGSYRLLSNMYASLSRWSDAKNVEDMIRFMGVKKTPGCSWIEVDSNIHIQSNFEK